MSGKRCTFAPKLINHKPHMQEIAHFIDEAPLWLTIIFFAVLAAMWIWCIVLLVLALRGK